MSEIVLGIGTSHSPVLAMEGRLWADRGQDDLRRADLHLADGRVVTYDQLEAEVGGRYADSANVPTFEKQYARAQECLDRLAAAVVEVAPDVLIVIGDDQNELFSAAHNPAFAVYTGDEIVMHPKSELHPDLPEWHLVANKGYQMDRVHRHRADPELARDLVGGLIEKGVDVAVASQVVDPYAAGFGHAFGFVAERLIRGADVAILPIMLNTYFPPNVPTPRRCFEIGRYIAEVVASLPGDRRVGVVASGGLSHFVTDEGLDGWLLDGLQQADEQALTSLPVTALRSGNSEILNWVMAGGALAGLPVTECEYIPVRRTPAGTGVGLAFTLWR